MARPTFDAGPVLRQAVLALDLGGEHDRQAGSVTNRLLAEVLGTSDRQVTRWRKGVRLEVWTADRAACRLGLHPRLLWPDW